MDRKTKIYNNNCGQPDMERATIVKYCVEVTGCTGKSAFLEHVSDAEKSNDYFFHFVPVVIEKEIEGRTVLKCDLISWIDQDISTWLSNPPHLVSGYASRSIESETVRVKVVNEEGWAVFDFDGSELINKRDCSDNEALEFFEKLYGGGEIIRVID